MDYVIPSDAFYFPANLTPLRISLFNRILQSTVANANTRIGNKILVKGIWFSFIIAPIGMPASSAHMQGTNCRIMVIRNAEAKSGVTTAGSSPGMTDLSELLVTATDTGSLRASPWLSRDRVKYDRIHNMSAIQKTDPT